LDYNETGATGGKGESGLPGTEVDAPSSVSSPATPLASSVAGERPEAVSFFGDDFLAGTVAMTLEQRGAYITLLSMQLSKGPLTKDEMNAITRDKIVHKKFQITDDERYINPRMEREVGKRVAHQSAQRERANARWITKNGNSNNKGDSAGAECPGNAAALPVLKDLKDKTKQDKQKDVYLAVHKTSNNQGDVLSLGVNDNVARVTDSAGAGGRETVVCDPEFDQRGAADEESQTTPAPEGATWRTDYAVYKASALMAYNGLLETGTWIPKWETYYAKFYPGANARKSFEKAFLWWSGEAGWKHKKKSKTKNIDWEQTFEKAMDTRMNIVYDKNSKPLTGGRTVYEFDRVAIESGKYDNLTYDD
jgi:uncharacterized protein YdaU (DUF1376 family)